MNVTEEQMRDLLMDIVSQASSGSIQPQIDTKEQVISAAWIVGETRVVLDIATDMTVAVAAYPPHIQDITFEEYEPPHDTTKIVSKLNEMIGESK